MAASLAPMSIAPTPGPTTCAQEDLVVDECGEEILPSLNASIAEVRSKVEEWAMSQKDALDSVHRSYAEELQTFREQRSELQEREATLREKAVQLSRELDKENAIEAALREEVKSLGSAAEGLPAQLDELRRRKLQQEEALDAEASAMAARNQQSAHEMSQLQDELAMFKRLGLQLHFRHDVVEGAEDGAAQQACADAELGARTYTCIEFEFTQIDGSAPDRRFKFSLRLYEDGDEQYAFDKAEPHVPEENVAAELQHANNANELGSLVRAMRREFKKLV